ncbi:diacylglycerol kinase [Microvirga flavescens]|uniref:diacylglycerol kinase n=1 Tax=Microvirga flavescens TaxID=2249811 RepID=UPI000DD5D264|nr:diacylglycerol kinase [Microvirga flavescens]
MNEIWAAFLNSWRGIRVAAATERAVRQEFILLAIAVPLSFLIGTTAWVRVALVSTILLLLVAEFLNTAVEKLCDHVNPDHHPAIGRVKDFGSAAVFCALVIAGLVWGTALFERVGVL